MEIRQDDLTGKKISDFLREHLEDMKEITPPESFHVLDLEALRSPEITFWSAWEDDELVGCGGADADLIIDNKLIDIKTTKKLEPESLHDFCQVIGYLLLHRISGINEIKELEINQLGIYYLRYGYLFLFNTKDLIDDNSLEKFTEWFGSRIS